MHLVAQNKSVVVADVSNNHGWATTGSDYYYLVLSGNGFFEKDGEKLTVKTGDAVLVPAGTNYNYGTEDGGVMKVVLFMNNLWK